MRAPMRKETTLSFGLVYMCVVIISVWMTKTVSYLDFTSHNNQTTNIATKVYYDPVTVYHFSVQLRVIDSEIKEDMGPMAPAGRQVKNERVRCLKKKREIGRHRKFEYSNTAIGTIKIQ